MWPPPGAGCTAGSDEAEEADEVGEGERARSVARPLRRVSRGVRGAGEWEHFAHGADIGVRGLGSSLETAFAQAATAMTAVVTDPGKVAATQCVHLDCEAPGHDLLLVEWLNALIYEMATRGMLFARFEIDIEGSRLSADAWGEPVEVSRHRPAVEVKGATYTALEVSRRADGLWLAQCVVDV